MAHGPKGRPGFPARLSPGSGGGAASSGPGGAGNRLLRPQAPLRVAHADADARRTASPGGLGLVSMDVRLRMVDRLRDASGVRDERVLAALAEVERHRFVDPALATQAYEDTSLPIGHGQTISKPSVVARMIELLLQGPAAAAAGSLGRTLEIGTGCGYQAALLCRLASDVFSIERLRALHDAARRNLEPGRPRNLRLIHADGMLGHPPNAPFRSIVSAAGGEHIPEAWLAQLEIGGRLVAPTGGPAEAGQVLVVVDRTVDGYRQVRHEGVRFVPLKSGAA